MVSAYADDHAIACRGASKTEVTTSLQREVDKVASWSNDAKLQLNNTKCEVSTFSNDGADSALEPPVLLGGCQLNVNRTPKFLGGKILPHIEIQ